MIEEANMEKTPNKDILCGPCRNLIANGSSPYYPPRGTTTTRVYDMKEEEHEPATSGHHLNFEAFTRSAASGCRVCSLLITQLTPWQRREMLRHNHMSDAKLSCSYISGHGKHPLVEVAYFMPPKTDGEKLEKVWLKLPLTETREDPCTVCNSRAEAEGPSLWSLATHWISDCLGNHPQCASQPTTTREHPTRLIFVGLNEDYSDVRVSCEVNPEDRYMTLSHRWAPEGGPVMLLESNLHQYSEQLPWEHLLPKFKDAIDTVRNLSQTLNVMYIWIDVLCILQDSTTDKEAEIAKMSGIYRHSLCNLAMCEEEDGQLSLHEDIGTLNLHECVLPVGPATRPSLRFSIDHWNLYEKLVSKSTLNSRAWVLQELVLAPRVLYFTTQQVIFECTETCCYQNSPRRNRGRLNRIKADPLIQQSRQAEVKDPDMVNYIFWLDKAFEYAKRTLTFESDKLQAISAIARLVQTQLQGRDEYILGLWKKYLYLHILWEHGDEPKTVDLSTIPEARRPSWSWISVTGSVTNFQATPSSIQNTESLVKLVPRVRYANENNHFGDASSAELDATGVVAKVQLEVRWAAGLEKGKNCANDARLLGGNPNENEHSVEDFFAVFDTLLGRLEEGKSFSLQAYCLFVVIRHWTKPDKHLIGLILSRLRQERGLYRRIGTFRVSQDGSKGLVEEIQARYLLAEEDYLEQMPDGSYRIKIL